MVRILLLHRRCFEHRLRFVFGLIAFIAFSFNISAQNRTTVCDTSGVKVICSVADTAGFVWEVHRFKDGQKWGNWQYFNAKGEMIKQIYYKRDRRIWSYQYRDGKVIESINKKGKIKRFKGCGC